jgi:hypothetical protein
MEKTLWMAEASLLAVQALHQHQHQHHVAPAHHHLLHTLKSAHAAPSFSGSHSLPVEEDVEETWLEQQLLLPPLEAQDLNAASVVKSAVVCFTTEATCTRGVSDPCVVDLLLTRQEPVLTRQEQDQEASQQEQDQDAIDEPIPASVHVRAPLGGAAGAEGVAGGKGGITWRDMVDVSYSEDAHESTVPQTQVGSLVVEANVITKPHSKVCALSKVF